jgi:AraC-like DNA-binding protein
LQNTDLKKKRERKAQPLTEKSMLTVTPMTSGSALVLQPGLPKMSFKDVLSCQSERFAVDGLGVSIYNLPLHGCASHQEDRYFFIYRPQGQNRNNPSMPLQPTPAFKQGSDNRCLLVAPNALIRLEWTNAGGRLAKFGFCPRLFEYIAKSIADFSYDVLERLGTVPFLFDRRLDALCRLLMEEAENDSQSGPLYLEALARELALSVLIRVHDNAQKEGQVRKINPSILRSIQQMKECFAKRLCVQEMAAQAGMSRRQFNRCFLHATGHAPHDYLLLVRLNRARDLMSRSGQPVCLKEIAGLCGFYDQTHLSRHFRRIFDTTPAEFLRAHERSHDQSIGSLGDGTNVLNFVRNVRTTALDSAIDVA